MRRFQGLFAVSTTCILAFAHSTMLAASSTSLSDAERIDRALTQLRAFNFEETVEILTPLHTQIDSNAEGWDETTYYLAIASWHMNPPSAENIDKAKSLFNELVETKPNSLFAASALLDLGRIEEVSDFLKDPVNVEAAQALYQRVREEYPNTEMSARATLFLAQTMAQSFDTDQVKEALNLLDQELKAQPESDWTGVMAQYAANLCAFYLHDAAAALPYYEKAIAFGLPRSSETDQYLWQYGLLAQEAGEDLLAAKQYSRIVREFPRSIYGSIARQRIIEIAERYPDAKVEVPELSTVGIGQ